MSPPHASRTRLRAILTVTAAAVALSGAFAASAGAHANSVQLTVAGTGGTVTGFAATKQSLNVVFDPNACASTFKQEATRDTSSFGEKIKDRYTYTFDQESYLYPVDKYVCVYILTRSQLHPKMLETAFKPLG
jgi:hypothetical protein